jgi:aryl-alcohol dehydrogenase-like predicted oxidoreductase
MQTRQLGNTDLQLTTVGLGTWAIGGGSNWKFGWGPQDEDDAIAAVLRAVELGINWVDTAAVYGDGNSERLVGRAIGQLKPDERPLVATKCGRIVQPDGTVTGDLSPASIQAECEASLERLGVEVIDLYQIHWPDPDAEIEAAWQKLNDLKKQGKVRHIGVSNFKPDQLDRIAQHGEVASLQPKYSMLAPNAEKQHLPYCAKNHIGVICYSPMGKGLLTGRFTTERAANLSDDDHRSRDPMFSDPQLSINLQMVEKLKTIAARHDRTVAELAIAWVLRRPEVTSAIVGARSPSQIEGTAAAGDWTLTEDEIAEIEALRSERKAQLTG